MAYPAHYLLQYGGTLHTNEQWSNNLRLVQDAGLTLDESAMPSALADIEADLRAFYASTRFHSGMKVEYCKLNRIGPDGKYASATNSNTNVFATPIVGTSSAAFPPQVALVATLTTAAARGYASRGRIFLAGIAPGAGTLQTADGGMTPASADAWAAAVAGLLNGLNNWPGLDASYVGLDVSVVSDGGQSLQGVSRKVTGVRVGVVYDTQRRRREDLGEKYSAAAAVS